MHNRLKNKNVTANYQCEISVECIWKATRSYRAYALYITDGYWATSFPMDPIMLGKHNSIDIAKQCSSYVNVTHTMYINVIELTMIHAIMHKRSMS